MVGHAISTGIVDIFVVYGSTPREGGIYFCAEAGNYIVDLQFNEFINELNSIKPNQGTFYNIDRVDNCSITVEYDDTSDEDISCTEDAKVCPDGSWVGRMHPNCEFAPCLEEIPPKNKNPHS